MNCETRIATKSDWNHSHGISFVSYAAIMLSFSLFLGRCSGSYYGIITPFPRAFENNWRVIGQRRAGARESNGRRWKSIGTASSNDSFGCYTYSAIIVGYYTRIVSRTYKISSPQTGANEIARQHTEGMPRATKRVESWTVIIRVRFSISSNWYFREN